MTCKFTVLKMGYNKAKKKIFLKIFFIYFIYFIYLFYLIIFYFLYFLRLKYKIAE